MVLFSNIYKHRRVLVTGHTGFKGSWLALWLQRLESHVIGFSLPPVTTPNHRDLLNPPVDAEELGDIRDYPQLLRVVQASQPEIVFHLAAQPLVRRSYRDPLETWSTNVVGTANVLEACRHTNSVKAIVVVTTDKCYDNKEQIWGYRETDALGGHDPYSASKAAAELVVASYRKSWFSQPGACLLASARAGNVIGGGDWSEDRLIPDAARAVASNQALEIRCPQATRPWQHVLESLAGYLLLGQQLLLARGEFAESWNFGPGPDGNRSVADVLQLMKQHWPELQWTSSSGSHPHEASLLQLDSTKSQRRLNWKPVWSIDEGVAKTAQWYHDFYRHGRVITHEQFDQYFDAAVKARQSWVLA